ncbi:hypothetical protein ABZ208_35280 [Streptomyces sp. NPDC006208]|uniref:hypothetical protein n=1 Tax=Streptomyces sp. NPDC006208 TaxID=3156734 RepID=UPI0033B6F14E
MTAPVPTPRRTRCSSAPIPRAAALSYGAGKGWNCYACGAPLTTGAVLAGRAEGRSGVHDISADVYACS